MPETVTLDEESANVLVERIANRLKPKEPAKTETPPAPAPTPATVSEKLSELSDDEVTSLADAIYEHVEQRKSEKNPESATLNSELKARMKENPRQALTTVFQVMGEARMKRDEAKREAGDTED